MQKALPRSTLNGPTRLRCFSRKERKGRKGKRQLHQCYCVDKLWPFNPHIRSESFAGEVEAKTRKIAANAVESAPKIGGFAVGVVENDGCGIELLRETSGAFETQSFSLRTSRDPCESKVGDKVIVVV